MNELLWILQLLLTVGFAGAGSMKLAKSKDWLHENKVVWVDSFSPRTIKLFGALEMLGAIGLLVPWGLNIAPVLTPIAAIGLAVMMVPAASVHARRREFSLVAVDIAFLAVSVVVAWGRLSDLAGS